LEVGVNDDYVEQAVEAISAGARTGKEGDGVIFVMEVGAAVRIRTQETGPAAMG
jgi:nitrogen regulatory protein P-II 1